MQHYGLTETNDINGLVYDQFALDVNLHNIDTVESVLAM